MLDIRNIDVMEYGRAAALQKETVQQLQSGVGQETLYLLEHPHVITRGRNATDSSLIADPALLERKRVTLADTDRGGDITYHGPGQLVGYPILRLETGRRDIRRFVNDLEESLLRSLARFGIEGRRDRVHRGVWIGDRKIASVGVRIARWVTSHGFALNVNTDLSYFSLIHPCGINGCPMTSMSVELSRAVSMERVKEVVVREFCDVFGRKPAYEMAGEDAGTHGY